MVSLTPAFSFLRFLAGEEGCLCTDHGGAQRAAINDMLAVMRMTMQMNLYEKIPHRKRFVTSSCACVDRMYVVTTRYKLYQDALLHHAHTPRS